MPTLDTASNVPESNKPNVPKSLPQTLGGYPSIVSKMKSTNLVQAHCSLIVFPSSDHPEGWFDNCFYICAISHDYHDLASCSYKNHLKLLPCLQYTGDHPLPKAIAPPSQLHPSHSYTHLLGAFIGEIQIIKKIYWWNFLLDYVYCSF